MMWNGVAGTQIGMRPDQVVLVNEVTGERKTLNVKGKMVYAVKCRKPEKTGESIYLSEKDRKNCTFVLILARGLGCIQDKTGIQPMRRVSCPDDVPTGIQRSPYNPEHYFIDEDLLQVLYETE